MEDNVEGLYAQAKRGAWGTVLTAWQTDPELASVCAHYTKPTSGWTFLHQAAYFGNEAGCRALIQAGASVISASPEGQTPSQVALARGHRHLAEVLDHAASGVDRLWDAPTEAGVLPSSCLWSEAQPREALSDLDVAYAGGRAQVREGRTYYVDSFGRVLVGWHGTTTPPTDMGGYPMVRVEDSRDSSRQPLRDD